jgi:hypothetical protein
MNIVDGELYKEQITSILNEENKPHYKIATTNKKSCPTQHKFQICVLNYYIEYTGEKIKIRFLNDLAIYFKEVEEDQQQQDDPEDFLKDDQKVEEVSQLTPKQVIQIKFINEERLLHMCTPVPYNGGMMFKLIRTKKVKEKCQDGEYIHYDKNHKKNICCEKIPTKKNKLKK